MAEQVREQARKFGIPHADITSTNGLPDEFMLGNKILITHVQKVFNGKTIFKLENKSVHVGAVVIDDSHACIDAIRGALTIRIGRSHPLYDKAFRLFSDDLRDQGEGSYLEIESGDYNTMLPIPYWSWFDKREEVIKAILEHREDNEVKYVWPLIKDQVHNCQAFISGETLEICPSLMPIESFGSFSRANHRILMSATTQDDSFFIKGLGFDSAAVANPLTQTEQKWSGEKMILLPALIHEDLDRDWVVNWLAKPRERQNFGIVFLTPSFRAIKQYEVLGAKVAKADDIFDVIGRLKDGDYKQPVVIANRYDGIDLPDNACRILVIDSKPFFDSLLDRYEESCRSSSDVINVRIAQKVEQGLGRSVRGEKDYSVIVLIGGDLVKFVRSPATSKYFSTQTQKQIEIGIQVATFANEDSEDEKPSKVLISLINQVLGRDDGWKEYYVEEMNGITESNGRERVHDLLSLEFAAERNFSIGDVDKACSIIQSLCDKFGHDQLEKGWYLQQLARYKYRLSKSDSNEIQKSAFRSNLQLLKPKEGITYARLEFINQSRVSRVRQWISSYSNYKEMIVGLDGILQDLTFGMPSEKFERALHDIGEAIGFASQRPDKEIKKGPDNLWCGVEGQYFLFECKSEVDDGRAEISKHEAGQMNSHCAWFESVYSEAKCKRILVIPTKNLSYHADFTHEVSVMRKGTLRKLKDNIRGYFKEFSQFVLHEVDDQKIQQLIDVHELDIASLRDKYCEPYRKATS